MTFRPFLIQRSPQILIWGIVWAFATLLPVSCPADENAFESITGENPKEDRARWDGFYKSHPAAYGKSPVKVLTDVAGQFKKGAKIFVPAMGEGRNALYLAEKGFDVTAVDISEVAVESARAEAKKRRLSLKIEIGDLLSKEFKPNDYDVVILSLFFRTSILDRLKKSLKSGGFLFVYNELKVGNRNSNQDADIVVSESDLKAAFLGFKSVQINKYTENGKPVIGILGQKP